MLIEFIKDKVNHPGIAALTQVYELPGVKVFTSPTTAIGVSIPLISYTVPPVECPGTV